jgi:branched-chain amino acid transport system ATP-binding protein
MLSIHEIHTFYGQSHVIQGISLHIDKGELVSLLGRNGAGKTTTLKSIMGITPPKSGTIEFKGVNIAGKRTCKIARLGVGYVPEDRRVFPNLTVLDNLEMGIQKKRNVEWTVERVYSVFPMLKSLERSRGMSLSGGEQQMLTIARTLMGEPKLLLLDEPSEGLAPVVVQELGRLMKEVKETLTIFLAEQNANFALGISDRGYIMEKGRISFQGSVNEIQSSEEVKSRYLSV